MYLDVLYPCLVIMSTKKHNNYFIFAGTPKMRKQQAVHLCGLLVFATNTASPAVAEEEGFARSDSDGIASLPSVTGGRWPTSVASKKRRAGRMPVSSLELSMGDKKDIFAVFAYDFELLHNRSFLVKSFAYAHGEIIYSVNCEI